MRVGLAPSGRGNDWGFNPARCAGLRSGCPFGAPKDSPVIGPPLGRRGSGEVAKARGREWGRFEYEYEHEYDYEVIGTRGAAVRARTCQQLRDVFQVGKGVERALRGIGGFGPFELCKDWQTHWWCCEGKWKLDWRRGMGVRRAG